MKFDTIVQRDMMELLERQQILFSDAQNCVYRKMEVILNSNQCEVTDNWRHLILSKQEWIIFFGVVT